MQRPTTLPMLCPMVRPIMRIVAVLLTCLMALPYGVWAQQKPVAALGRVAVLGEVTEGQKRILTNRVESFLSGRYELISEDEYLAAEEEAFLELEEEECTEEACVRLIQEILQVERLFILQIIREEELTQISMTLYRADTRRVVEDICEECSIGQLYRQVEGLAQRLMDEDFDLGAVVRGPVEEEEGPALRGAVEPEPEAVAEEEDEGGIPWWVWVLGAVGIAGLAALAGDSGGGGGGGGGGCPSSDGCGSVDVSW